MNLSQKYRHHSLVVLFVVLILGFASEYIIYSNTIRHTTDNVLMEYRRDIEDFAHQSDSLIAFSCIISKHSAMRKVEADMHPDYARGIYDSLIYSPYAEAEIVHRVAHFPVVTSEGEYEVRLVLPTMEKNELLVAILISSICFFIIFACTSLYAIRYMDRITRPFYKLLEQIRHYDIRSNKPLEPIETKVEEFQELSKGLYGMMNRMHHDYGAMKELLENSSHELQTPLSVIRMKLEQLSQLCANSEEQLKYIVEMRSTLQRLSSLNRSILLISRISNDHFWRQEKIDLKSVLEGFLTEHEEMIEAAQVSIEWKQREQFEVNIHPVLSEVLISNLLSNAMKYNMPHGKILIDCTAQSLTMKNTYSNIIPDGNLFDRYICSEEHEQASGLGLPIVKEICAHNDMEAKAGVEGNYFSITLSHKPKENQETD